MMLDIKILLFIQNIDLNILILGARMSLALLR